MSAYRFCRPDDLPLLVRAVNECFVPYFPGSTKLTVEDFRREMKELDLWPSNSMVAMLGEEPIAVLTATKRPREVLVARVGVHRDHRRRGHGSHVLTSLSQKLAVLGPPRLVAEVPGGRPDLDAFFTAAGWSREALLTDWVRPPGELPEPVPEGLVIPVTVEDLEAHGALAVAEGAAWERSRETLLQRRGRLAGLAIASPERFEAWLLVEEAEPRGEVEVWGAGCADPARREALLGVLLRELLHRHPESEVRFPKLLADEVPEGPLERLGFSPRAQTHRWAAEARPL